MMQQAISIIFSILFRYGVILINVLTIIVGLVLAKRQNSGKEKIIPGCIIPVIGVVLEFGIQYLFGFVANKTLYVIVMVLTYFIRAVTIYLSFRFFANYKMASWVKIIVGILGLVYLFRSIYYAGIVFGMADIINGTITGNKGMIDVLSKFFNKGSTLTIVNLLCTYVPPAIIFVDAVTTTDER